MLQPLKNMIVLVLKEKSTNKKNTQSEQIKSDSLKE